MRIYFLVATQDYNLGDLLINKMLIDELSRYGTVYVDSAGVSESFQKYLFENKMVKNFEIEYGGSLKRLSALRLLPAVKKDFCFYFKSPGPSGGGLDSFSGVFRRLALLFEFAYLYYGKVHLNLVGNDIFLQSKLDVLFEKCNLHFFDHCLVRSKKNRDYLRLLKIQNIDYIPDMAFLYSRVDLSPNKDSVFISFRDLNDESYSQEIVFFLERNIPYFVSNNIKVVFMYQVKSDKEFNQRLYEKFKEEGVLFIDNCFWFDDIYKYNNAKYLVTNRLHVMLLGIVHHSIPILLLNGNQKNSKISNILLDCELSELSVRPSFLIEDIDKDYSKYKSNIVKLSTKERELCQTKIRSVFDKV